MREILWIVLAAVVAAASAAAQEAAAPAASQAAPKPGQVLFSPNGDGIMDNAVFHLGVSDPQNVTQWDFVISDALGRQIKEFSGKGAPPRALEWNGKDQNNQLIRDGSYQYVLSVITLAGSKVSMPPQELICDRQAPTAQVSVEPSIFSPEEGSAKPTARFSMQSEDASALNSWLLRIKSPSAVKSFFGQGEPPASVVWDGRTDAGDPAPNGDYSFTLAVRDRAGNTTTTSPQTVRIDRTEPVMQVEAKPAVFSPNGDGARDAVSFEITPPAVRKRIEKWTLSIDDLRGKPVRSFDGAGDPPRELPWDGSGFDGKTVADGAYSYTFLTVDQAGNRGLTIPKTVVVDTKAPPASVELSPALLSPNGDGFEDSGVFRAAAQDENGIESYALEIRNDVGDLKRVFKGDGAPPKTLQWGGQDDAGNALPDGKYAYTLTVVDRAGNKTVTDAKTGQIDTNAPVVDFTVDPMLISPNGDQKEALFHVAEQDASEVEAWSLKIADGRGKVVRRYEGKGALNGDLSWDGRDDGKRMVEDGAYACTFWTQDKAHNAVSLAPKTVTVGARIPDIAAEASLPDFSPNADGVKDAIAFAVKVRSFNQIRSWALDVDDASGVRVREFSGQGQPPAQVPWSGERDDKSLASDGRYSYSLHVVDEAGNKADAAPRPVQLDTTRPEISARAVPALFSPNGDGVADAAVFQLGFHDESAAGPWTLAVRNEAGRAVRRFSGEGSVPATVEWDGRDELKKVVPDGSYTYTLTAEDAVGNRSTTLEQIVRVDDTPPEVTLSVSPAVFAPKAESGRSSASFSDAVQDSSNLASWLLRISDAKGSVVQEFKGEGRPGPEMGWDGVDAKGSPFPDGQYEGRLFVTDEVGNKGESPAAKVSINAAKPMLLVAAEEESVPSLMPEVKTEQTDRGLVIPLAAEVLFQTGKADVKPEAYATLDEAAAIVRKYVGRRILIEGHTDNVPIHGEFPDNRALSQARAESVRAYFVKLKGIDGSRLLAKGWGDTRPIGDNATPEGRRKNRRVEIIIEKPGAGKAVARSAGSRVKGRRRPRAAGSRTGVADE